MGGRLACYNDGDIRTEARRVNPLVSVIITGIAAFAAHVLLVLALRSK